MLLEHYLKYLQEENILKTKFLQFFKYLQRNKTSKNINIKITSKEKINLKKIRYLNLINKFKISKSDSLIMGSAVLVLHGLLKKNHDIDVAVTRQTLNKIRLSKKFVKDYKFDKVFYKTPNGQLEAAVGLYKIMNETMDNLLKRSDNVDNYRFMSLSDTYKLYKFLDRPKDVEKLKALKDYFKQKKVTLEDVKNEQTK